MATKTIEEIKAKKQEALRRFNREIQLAKTRENQKNRTVNARKKYLIGAFVLDKLPSMRDVENPKFSWGEFDRWLTRDADRALFELPPKQANRIILHVPAHQKDDAKALGAKFDSEQLKWYVPDGLDTAPFKAAGWL